MESTHTHRLLIIEDDDAVRRVLTRQLSQWWDVRDAPNGEAGLQRFREFAPDVVLSDWVMPGLHGEEFLRALRREDSTVPIVVMTGKSSEDKAIKSVGLACAFLRKPVAPHKLHETLEGCLDEALARQGRGPVRKGKISFCRWTQSVSVCGGGPISLTMAELQVFLLLWERAGQLVTQKEIAEAASGRSMSSTPAASGSRYAIHQLRGKIEPDSTDPRFIVTIRGQGVKLVVGGVD